MFGYARGQTLVSKTASSAMTFVQHPPPLPLTYTQNHYGKVVSCLRWNRRAEIICLSQTALAAVAPSVSVTSIKHLNGFPCQYSK